MMFKEFYLASSYFLRGKETSVDINGIFEIVPTKEKINAVNIQFGGEYPYVARGAGNNGIRGYINYDVGALNPGNTIAFGQDTATLNYQSEPYFTGDKIQIFKLNPKYGELNERRALYLIGSINKIFANYSWGQQSFAVDKIAYLKVMLPCLKDGTPDFDYMESYIAELEQQRLAELEQQRLAELDCYLKATGLNDYELTDEDKKSLTLSLENQHLTKSQLWKMISKMGN